MAALKRLPALKSIKASLLCLYITDHSKAVTWPPLKGMFSLYLFLIVDSPICVFEKAFVLIAPFLTIALFYLLLIMQV